MVRLDDLRLFAKLAETGSFSAAARALGMPKQTLSRRILELEAALAVPLVQRTTRRVRLTEVGQAYALHCQEIARLAEQASDALRSQSERATGLLRVTADTTFGEVFVWPVTESFLRQNPDVNVELLLTNRTVDLIEEGVDVAFRVGKLADSSLVSRKLGPARLLYCAAPSYLEHAGAPETPRALADHALIDFAPGPGPTRWPFFADDGPFTIAVHGRIRVNSLSLARRAALTGFGIGNFPSFAVEADIAAGRLVAVLNEWTREVGAVQTVYPQHRFLLPRVRRFLDLVHRELSVR